jgi:hypothetical protein
MLRVDDFRCARLLAAAGKKEQRAEGETDDSWNCHRFVTQFAILEAPTIEIAVDYGSNFFDENPGILVIPAEFGQPACGK